MCDCGISWSYSLTFHTTEIRILENTVKKWEKINLTQFGKVTLMKASASNHMFVTLPSPE